MPSPETLVAGLMTIANDAIALAVLWHAALIAAWVALGLGWRPSRKVAGTLLVAPVASVSALAFGYGNPFDGMLFGALALSLLALAVTLAPGPVDRGRPAATALGLVTIGLAWVYPYFLVARAPLTYVVAAPVGLAPSPSLLLVVGFTLLAGGLGSRAWCVAAGAAGIFYGFLGATRLGVAIDLALVASSVAALALAVPSRRPVQPSSRALS